MHLACGSCHFEHDPATLDKDALLKEKYLGDEHGHGLVAAGLVVSATCVSCHGGHDMVPVASPESRVARQHVDQVCGQCHVGALEEYRKSIHHRKSTADTHHGATCTDCHRPHHIQKAALGPGTQQLLNRQWIVCTH